MVKYKMLNDLYVNDWNLAIERTKKFGFSVSPAASKVVEKRYLKPEVLEKMPHMILKSCGEIGLAELVGQCMSIHHRLAPVISEFLECEATFTLGWVLNNTEELFKFDDVFIEETIKNGHKNNRVNLHAWITLPSMEVIDFSLPTTIGYVKGKKEMYGATIASHPDEFTKGLKYKPMLLGDEYLQKTGLLVNFQFIEIDRGF